MSALTSAAYEVRFFWRKGRDHGRAINLRKLDGLHFSESEKRTDDYLCLSTDSVGVKWRGGGSFSQESPPDSASSVGSASSATAAAAAAPQPPPPRPSSDSKRHKLELKHRSKVEADGLAEYWQKYTLADEKQLIQKLKELNVFAEPHNDQSLAVFPVRTIHKKRRHARFNGCVVEQAELKIDAREDESVSWFGRRWRSVALEAATAQELVAAVDALMRLAPKLAEAREAGRLHVCGYPGFLNVLERLAVSAKIGA